MVQIIIKDIKFYLNLFSSFHYHFFIETLHKSFEKVIQHANIPVLSVSHESNFQLKNILIVTDLSQEVPSELFALAKYFQQAGGVIHFVNVINKEVIKEQEVINKSWDLQGIMISKTMRSMCCLVKMKLMK